MGSRTVGQWNVLPYRGATVKLTLPAAKDYYNIIYLDITTKWNSKYTYYKLQIS